MNRNPKNKHLKRINAPKAWLLDKLSGVWVSNNHCDYNNIKYHTLSNVIVQFDKT